MEYWRNFEFNQYRISRRNEFFNSLRPRDAYMGQWCNHYCFRSLMACRLAGAKPLSETKAGILFIETLMNKLQWNFNPNYNSFIQRSAFESVVCDILAILSRPQWGKDKVTWDMESRLSMIPYPRLITSSTADCWSGVLITTRTAPLDWQSSLASCQDLGVATSQTHEPVLRSSVLQLLLLLPHSHPVNNIRPNMKQEQSEAAIYRQVSNISHTLVGNEIVDHSDVVGASPVGAAPTTSSFST